MKFNEDRGTILRITFDIVYPSGQMKTVAMSMSDYDKWKDIGLIALNEEAINKFIVPALKANKSKVNAKKSLKKFNKINKVTGYKNALLVVNNDGSTIAMCGAHHSTGHLEKGNSVFRYI